MGRIKQSKDQIKTFQRNELQMYSLFIIFFRTTQTEYKKWEAKECEKQKKVNLNPVDWTNNPDKYLLELAGSYQAYGNGNGN